MKKINMFILILLVIIPINIKAEELKLADSAKSAIMIEASTGEILFEKNSHEKLHPASMTKMMSMLLIIENIEQGNLKWDDVVTVSQNASSMGGSQILLETGEQMKVEDLFKGIAVASGNDAVVALAETIAGTEEMFVDMMNKRANELGLTDTNFKNPHGLDDANHYSSAFDMSLIAKELVKHEKVLEYTSIYEDYLRADTDRKLWLVNTNKLVRFYSGVDGLKTGYTEDAGYCLTATAKKNNMRIITVVMGEPDSQRRNAETTAMLDYAFSQYKVEEILSKDSVLATKRIEKGKKAYVDIVPLETVTLLTKKTEKVEHPNYELKINKITSPVKKGDVVGTLKMTLNDTERTINLTVKEDIEKANIIELYLRNLVDTIDGDIR